MNLGHRQPVRFMEGFKMISRLHGVLFLLLLSLIPYSLAAQVSSDRLLHSSAEPQNWLTYSGDYASHRYSRVAADRAGERKGPGTEMGVPGAIAAEV